MKSPKLSVPPHYISTMLAIASDHNCDPDKLLIDIGIDPKDIAQGNAISPLHYGELHHHIIELVQNEWFGMLSGGDVPKGAIRLLIQLIVNCKDLEEAILRAGEFFEICRGFKIKQVLVDDGDYVICKASPLDCIERHEFDELLEQTSPHVIKSTLSAWHGCFSWLIGKYLPVDTIYYNFPDDGSKYLNQHLYDHAFIGHRFHKKHLKCPIVQGKNNIDEFMRKAPYYILIKKNPDEGLSFHVKTLLAKSIGAELPTASDVAKSFNISVTTLHRRLGNEGQSFQTLKDESRMEAAIHYLNSPDISTAAISDLLSFENPSTFYRFFKKWAGLPPGQYRKELLGLNTG